MWIILGVDNAIADAIDYCIENGILAEFLQKNRDEVMVMLCAEYSLEDYKADMEQYVQELKEQVAEQREYITDLEKENARVKDIEKENARIKDLEKENSRLKELLRKTNNHL